MPAFRYPESYAYEGSIRLHRPLDHPGTADWPRSMSDLDPLLGDTSVAEGMAGWQSWLCSTFPKKMPSERSRGKGDCRGRVRRWRLGRLRFHRMPKSNCALRRCIRFSRTKAEDCRTRFRVSRSTRCVSTFVRQIVHGFGESAASFSGSLIHAIVGMAGGDGTLRTKRSGCSA